MLDCVVSVFFSHIESFCLFVCFLKGFYPKGEIKGQNHVRMSIVLILLFDGSRTLWVLNVHFTTGYTSSPLKFHFLKGRLFSLKRHRLISNETRKSDKFFMMVQTQAETIINYE